MSDTSSTILARYGLERAKINLALRPAYRGLLAKLGDPHRKLPPVFHVAGTNGKGSTCAFLRSMLEAAGYKVHVYTSPHLVTIHERFRVAGTLIGEQELVSLMTETEKLVPEHNISFFEFLTAVAFAAFARTKADFTILEVGLGGRLDATNVVENPLATLIARLSFDHREYLGDTLDKIAFEKAGIMRKGIPCFAAAQPDPLALRTLRDAAAKVGTTIAIGGAEWKAEAYNHGFLFTDASRTYDLPEPALLGRHQYQNAGLAIAALCALPKPLPLDAVVKGLQTVEWPARLQRLGKGPLTANAPEQAEVWLDGGHNDSAGEVLAEQIERWRNEDGATPKPLYVVLGMLTTKRPAEFLAPFARRIVQLRAVPVPGEGLSFDAGALAGEAKKLGIPSVEACEDVAQALRRFTPGSQAPFRILICGSLYLAGWVLAAQSGRTPIPHA